VGIASTITRDFVFGILHFVDRFSWILKKFNLRNIGGRCEKRRGGKGFIGELIVRSAESALTRHLRTSTTGDRWRLAAQANRAKFRGMPVNESAGHAEGVRQFTDRH